MLKASMFIKSEGFSNKKINRIPLEYNSTCSSGVEEEDDLQ